LKTTILIAALSIFLNIRGQTLKDSAQVNSLNKQVMEIVYSNTAKAKDLCFRSITLAKSINFKKGEASANSRLGIAYDVEGQYDSAIYYYRIAYGINKKIGNKKGQGAALSNIGLVYLNINDYANAITNLRAAIKPLEEAREHEYLGNCYNNIGLMYTELDNYQRAMDNFNLAQKEYATAGNTRQMAYVISNIAMILSEKHQYDSAIMYEHKAIPYFEKDSDYYNLAKCYNNIGVDYTRMNDNKNAEKSYLTSIKYASMYNSKGGLADTYANLATVYSVMGDFKQSEVYASKAFELLPYLKSPKIKADLLFLCGRIKIRQGDYKSATKYLMDSKSLKDSIFKKEAAELLTKSEIRYGLERKENENKQLHAQNRIQQLELRNTENEIESRKTFNVVVIALSALIIVLLVLYLRRRLVLQKLLDDNKNRAELQEQRIGISHELHDNVGAQLSYIVSNLEVMLQKHPEDKRLNSLSDMSKQAIITLRETVWALNNESISVTDFADKFKQYTAKILHYNQDTTCTFEEQFQDNLILQPVQALNLFRICQEAFSNSIHHSNASIIRVQFSNSGSDVFTVSIQDNGIGFDQEEAALKGHYGLSSMRSRARDLGAEFTINSVKDEGTQVIFTLKKS
jgi:signal transduction histidine kinase